ncbi:hypothetical protein Sm713_38560 [Streptomyces sp. TS71-3]|nr:hypothetical protein Sm713_38560 [Streptomyces sp. TS71-3]
MPLAPYGEDGPDMKTEVRQAAVTTVVLAVCGVLLGLLWVWLAPHVPLIADAQAVYLKDSEGEQAVGVDGVFTLLAIGFGVLSAPAVFLARRHGGVPVVVALALGGLLGGLIAWRLGIWLGPAQDVTAHARQVGKGVTFDAPLELKAKGALLAWPVAAILVHLALTALFGPRDPEEETGGPYPGESGGPYKGESENTYPGESAGPYPGEPGGPYPGQSQGPYPGQPGSPHPHGS